MPVSVPEFWKLLADSRLLAADDCQRRVEAFAGVKGASRQANAATLSEWLVAERALTRYQASVLLAGRSLSA